MTSPQPARKTGVVRALWSPLRRLRSDYRELTAPLRGLPSALVIGTQKGGTTSLFNYLVQHPDVLQPFAKEIHYFDLHHERGLRWYRGRFPYSLRLRGGALTLDASPYYLVHPQVPRRAAELLPEAKLIAVLRNPVDRALSHYQHEVRGGRETLSFADAVDREPERVAGEEERLASEPKYYSHNHHRFTYIRRGQYVEQLRRWVEHYPRSQLLVLQSEWLFRDPAAATEAVQRFLGLGPHRIAHYKPFLQGKYEREMPPNLRARLAAYFEPYNRELYQWLGEEFDWA
ncbi:MAG: sulfotransferase domain-containing protein [Gemmatimonadales bacterium]